MKKDEVGLSQRKKEPGYRPQYQEFNEKNQHVYDSVIGQSDNESKNGTSVGKGLFVIGALALSIVGIGWFTWMQVPDEMKNYALDSIPFIERVEPKVIGSYQEKKQTPGPDLIPPVKTEPSDPLYEIHALMNDGNELRVDIKVHYVVKNDGGPIGKGHHRNMVRMAVTKVISQHNTEELYTMDRLKIESLIHNELQKKYFKDIIEVEIYSFNLHFNARTKAMFDNERRAKMAVEVAKQELEMTILRQKIAVEELKAKVMIQQKEMQMERDKKLYQTETQKMVDDILKKKKKAIDDEQSDLKENLKTIKKLQEEANQIDAK